MRLVTSSDYVVAIGGGLGNQLFQLAFGFSLSRASGRKVLFEKTQYRTDRTRSCAIPPYSEVKFLSDRVVHIWRSPRRREGVLRCLLGMEPAKPFHQFHQHHYHGWQELLDANANYYMGNWQLRYYVEDSLDRLRSILLPAGKGPSTGGVCVHVRRGDYISNPEYSAFMTRLDEEYYAKAVELSRDTFGSEVKYYVYSDSLEGIQLLQRVVPRAESLGSPANSPVAEMQIMVRHDAMVMANSTFSWMVAALGLKPNYVWAPKDWYRTEVAPEGFYFPEWNLI